MDKDLRNQIDSRERIITTLLQRLEGTVNKAQRRLFETVQQHFLDSLERNDQGMIASSLKNRRLLERFESVFNRYAQTSGAEIAVEIAKGANAIMETNRDYYSLFASGKTQLNKISDSVNQTMRGWLGIDTKGNVAKNGYLETIIANPTVRNQIKDQTLRAVVGQQGWMQTRDEMRDFIIGNKSKTGIMERYYRNYVYDTYSHLDRAVSEQYGNDLGLNFAIYEGGLIEASREFCKEHNGNVYHRTEIAKFKPTKAIPPNYNPFLDLGGYGCRHHLNWIPDSVAVRLRPEAKRFIDGDPTPQQQEKQAEMKDERFELTGKNRVEMEDRGYDLSDLTPKNIITERFKGFDFAALDNVIEEIFSGVGINGEEARKINKVKKQIYNSGNDSIAVLKATSNKFTVVRKFKFEYDQKIVYHDFFALSKANQGKGYSKKLFAELFKQYENAGVDLLQVYANIDVGGYTWAKYGFKAAKSSVSYFETGMLNEQEKADFKSVLDRYKWDERIDMLELANKPYGKKLLLGSSWDGELDMNDPVQVAIFKDYLGL